MGDGGGWAHVLFVVVEVRFHRGPRLRHIDVSGMQGVPQVAEPWHLHRAPPAGAVALRVLAVPALPGWYQ